MQETTFPCILICVKSVRVYSLLGFKILFRNGASCSEMFNGNNVSQREMPSSRQYIDSREKYKRYESKVDEDKPVFLPPPHG